ncbi:hypothetical protein ATE92_0175 [Ulvibacter sp. MAR_2010_11]|uniref:hypothetical protein n=1 Tax=Ulvibacter sp. MAR_2010_11 TaxID=1250229 RepID=UPI000C2C3ABB|nr:hypothetical protein [Ulvibacter sp. MAR_2010_11]PKA82050.1 hypothetical protein ATE92_0175 [Ulvibacter sp. MAR_2010_11]
MYTILNKRIFIVSLLVCCYACKNDAKENNNLLEEGMVFDHTKWQAKEGDNYIYRDKMLNDVVYNDTVRSLNKEEILVLLGEPDRINENVLYYTIDKKQLGFWTLHTRTMVIQFSDSNTVDWIKIHE